MRIYLAGAYNAFMMKRETTEGMRMVYEGFKDYPWHLESYYYMKAHVLEHFKQTGKTMFLDSGAFTAYTKGATIAPKDYATFIQRHAKVFHVYSNLDVIGRTEAAAEGTWQNQKYFESLGLKPCPVFHARDDDKWLRRYIDAGYDYIFLGGMVPENSEYLRSWLDRLWTRYLAKPDGTAAFKIHGFGMTTLDLMLRYPWYSIDSTSWLMTGRYGACFIDIKEPDGRITDHKLAFSAHNPRTNELDQHFDTLPKATQKRVTARIEELGYKVADLRVNFGWRDHFNIAYFRRMMDRRVDRFQHFQRTLF